MANPGNLVPHKFRPGQSGNPGGRPQGVMEYARKQTKDGKVLVDLLVSIVKGEKGIRGVRPTFDHRIQAVRELFNRGWGRVPDSEVADVRTIILTVTDPRDLPVVNGDDGRPGDRGDVAPQATALPPPDLRAPASPPVSKPRGRWMAPEELDAEADAAITRAGGPSRTMGPRSFGPPE